MFTRRNLIALSVGTSLLALVTASTFPRSSPAPRSSRRLLRPRKSAWIRQVACFGRNPGSKSVTP